MRFRRLALEGLTLSLIAVYGCQPPDDIIPVTAPGATLARTPVPGDEAQAQGESPLAVQKTDSVTENDLAPALPTKPGEKKTTKSGVIYETLQEGTGPEIQSGQRAIIEYEGKLVDGKIFDSTRNKTPGDFKVGKGGQVIKGWNEAVPGMKVGEKRRLTIPPQAGYGSTPQSKIPPNSTLIFEVELKDVR